MAQVSVDNASLQPGWSSVCRSGTASLCLSGLQNAHICHNIMHKQQQPHVMSAKQTTQT